MATTVQVITTDCGGGMKEKLWAQLRGGRALLCWKLDGLSEYQLRRPMTPTGTNLLGVMKHLAGEEYGYLGEVFGRPAPEHLACVDDGTLWNYGDMWATPQESSAYIKDFYHRACAHADETIGSLHLDAEGSVPWWDEANRTTTLGAIMLLIVSETERHGGHADIVRELIDGSIGGPDAAGAHNFPDAEWSHAYVAQLAAGCT